ncbi:GFA family protein [Bosea sp. TAB14]|uniref:GFA family protein n=1 Tax=Bosea sp. TAB14 TaxID=3237481 RepID=UPI003F91306B
METHAGGCLCGTMRYSTRGEPVRVTVCHCRFCQRATGSAYMVEPVFEVSALEVTAGEPSTFELQSAGSRKTVRIHFCSACGTKLFLTFERFPSACGIYAGTYDDPHWFAMEPATAKHIFVSMARPDSIIPAGLPVYAEHASTNDGVPHQPVVLENAAGPSDCLMLLRR